MVGNRASLNDTGTFIFYATHPEIDDSQTFNGKCGRKEQGTAVIGCYVDNRIYVYDVTDKRLDGIKEVTAAHEMLHAAYERMGDSERTKVNQLIEVEYAKLKDDPSLAERMAFYARTEPGERDNELHSIIGTEVASISPELEAHYAKYFKMRSDVVALHAAYNQNFIDLENQKKTLGNQLDTLKQKIDLDKISYAAEVDALNSDIRAFEQKAKSGGFTTQTALNSQRNALQARIDAVNEERDAINSEIDQFKTLVDQYNQTITQSQDLYKSIDSTLTPAPQV